MDDGHDKIAKAIKGLHAPLWTIAFLVYLLMLSSCVHNVRTL